MTLLLIDTSSRTLSIAISKDGKVLSYSNTYMQRMMNHKIIPLIDTQLKKHNLRIQDIDAFAIGRGPGAFTSLRVGMATIKGLAFALNKPVIACMSLDAIAFNVKQSFTNLCVVVDAKRQLVYSAFYKKENGIITLNSDYKLSSIKEVVTQAPKDTLFIGDGAIVFADDISVKFTIIDKEKLYTPQAKNFVGFATKVANSKGYDDVDSLELLYLYPDDCQVNKVTVNK
ncbi:MAG: tRNA threonylcarbamoyladenosine biosynthesis protein TsaB [Lysobacterales bacterium]|jgi:tRNA threonylcarbamoyladenosine biosynthesis protein TsaB